ncbi:MAG: hypothetical protein GXP24_03135 [Planctomycetes bacterium]|nr:hypothetical protein [Planctomycetota bacterium]
MASESLPLPSDFLPSNTEAAVLRTHGGPVPVPGEQGNYVVMTMDIFRDMAGVGDDADFAASVDALKVSLDQAKAGMTMPLSEILPRLQEKHGI